MVVKNGFEIQLLDSNKKPLREYAYTGEPCKDNNKRLDISEIYVEVPRPDQDQTFSILIKNVNNNNGEHFFVGKYDGIQSATGHSIIAPNKVLEINEMGLQNKTRTNYADYHKPKFESLPIGFEDDSSKDDFGKIEVNFYRSESVPRQSEAIVHGATFTNFTGRKRPYSMVDSDTTDSTGTSTPSTIYSGKKQKLAVFTSGIAKFAKSHCVGLGDYTHSDSPTHESDFVGKTIYRVIFHYRSKNALRHLGVITGSSKGSPTDGAILQEAIKKLEKQKNGSKAKEEGEKQDEQKDKQDDEDEDEEEDQEEDEKKNQEGGKEPDEEDGEDSDAEALCKQLRDTYRIMLD